MDAQNHLLFLIVTLVFLLQVSLVFSVVNVDSTLSTNGNNTSWLSPSGEFAFGFRQLNGTSTSNFSIAIWYNKIPDKTIVWHATTDEGLAEAPPGSQVRLKKEGLTLRSPQGDSIWTSKLADDNDVVSYASMLDSGNFVLVNGESKNVWESFQNPTDTLLPNQSLQDPTKLTGRFSETNYTRGRYQLYFWNGNMLISPLAWPTTFQYGTYYEIDASGNGSQVVFNNTSGDIYVVTTNGTTRIQLHGESWQRPQITLDDPKRYYYRATLDYHGVFAQYAHPRNITTQQGWKVARYVPDNICTAIDVGYSGGVCGFNSYCTLQNNTPTCTCLDGYSLVDPSNQFGGCQSNFTLVCGPDAEEMYDMVRTTDDDVFFSGANYEYLKPYSKEGCQQSCLHDCFCALAIYDSSQGCDKKGLPLFNGQVREQSGRVTFVKRGRLGGASPEKENHAKSILLGSIIGSVLLFTIIIAIIVFYNRKRPKRSIVQAEINLQSFTYDQLQNNTKNFSEELGRGGFGIVYKGTIENVVAVKELKESGQQGENDFKTELNAITKTSHKNVLKLIGFCAEGIHRMLVSEFMSRGTLANALFEVEQPSRPAWNQRVEFALGIARGLVYLHQESIIHCDINPQNILIDGHFTAKISDFGFAKLLSHDQIKIMTLQQGTPGYIAPEWRQDVPVTNKVDVYSFGVMLLQIICCKRNVLPRECKEKIDAKLEGRIGLLVEGDGEAKGDSHRLKKWIKIAIWCVQENPKDRPTMKKVVQMLEGKREVPNPPIVKSKSH